MYLVQLDRIQRRFFKFLSFKLDRIYPDTGDQDKLLRQRGMAENMTLASSLFSNL